MAYRSDFLDVRGVRTHVMRGGRGNPLLVLHPEFAAPIVGAVPRRPGGALSRPRAGSSRLRRERAARLARRRRRSRLPLCRPARRAEHRAGVDRRHVARRLDRRRARASPTPHASSAWCSPRRPASRSTASARYDFFANPIEETLRHLFHDPSRAAQLLPTEFGADVIVRGYHEFTTLARLVVESLPLRSEAAAAPAARAARRR